jgi:hypothetical protein
LSNPTFQFYEQKAFVLVTKSPAEAVTEAMVIREIRRARLHVGDLVSVECRNHTDDRLLAQCEFRVITCRDEMKQTERPDFSIHQAMETTFEVRRVTEWRVFGGGQTVKGKAVWNVGRNGYVIEVDGQEVGFERDKATAHRIAAGELPLPAEAA